MLTSRLVDKYPGQVKLGNMVNLLGALWENFQIPLCSACNRLVIDYIPITSA